VAEQRKTQCLDLQGSIFHTEGVTHNKYTRHSVHVTQPYTGTAADILPAIGQSYPGMALKHDRERVS